MNHCITCGRLVSRGRTHTSEDAVRCLICQTEYDMCGWRFETPVMRLRSARVSSTKAEHTPAQKEGTQV